MNIMYLLNYI